MDKRTLMTYDIFIAYLFFLIFSQWFKVYNCKVKNAEQCISFSLSCFCCGRTQAGARPGKLVTTALLKIMTKPIYFTDWKIFNMTHGL